MLNQPLSWVILSYTIGKWKVDSK